jgi:Holliday junction resolvase RusA-like endonuclease
MENDTGIKCCVSLNPPKSTAQMKGVSWRQRRFFEKPEAKDARLSLEDAFRRHAPAEPMQGPVEVWTSWVFPNIKADRGLLVPHAQKPDVDNLLKAFFDVLTHLGYWTDDKQVVRVTAEKWRGPKTGIALMVSKFQQD